MAKTIFESVSKLALTPMSSETSGRLKSTTLDLIYSWIKLSKYLQMRNDIYLHMYFVVCTWRPLDQGPCVCWHLMDPYHRPPAVSSILSHAVTQGRKTPQTR